MSDEKPMGQVIQIDEARIRDHLGEMVRGTVEETLNAMLDAEAEVRRMACFVVCGGHHGRGPGMDVLPTSRWRTVPAQEDAERPQGYWARRSKKRDARPRAAMQALWKRAGLEMIEMRVCVIRRKAATDSDAIRPPIPTEVGHPFRWKPATL